MACSSNWTWRSQSGSQVSCRSCVFHFKLMVVFEFLICGKSYHQRHWFLLFCMSCCAVLSVLRFNLLFLTELLPRYRGCRNDIPHWNERFTTFSAVCDDWRGVVGHRQRFVPVHYWAYWDGSRIADLGHREYEHWVGKQPLWHLTRRKVCQTRYQLRILLCNLWTWFVDLFSLRSIHTVHPPRRCT